MDKVLSPDYFTPDENKALARQLYRMAIQLNNAIKKNMDKKSVHQQSVSAKSQQMTSNSRKGSEIINEPQHEQERQICPMPEMDQQKASTNGKEASEYSSNPYLEAAYSRIIAQLEELTGQKCVRVDAKAEAQERAKQKPNSATIHLVQLDEEPYPEQEIGPHWPRR